MRLLGIDYGTKRMGIALSDPDETMAHPMETISVSRDGSHIKAICEIIQAYQVEKVVVGLPYNMDGTLGNSGEEVLRWGKNLEKTLDLPVDFWDERLTTSEAHDFLINLKVKGKKRKSIVDKIAASIILKDYMDSKRS
jgi:putative holliday junction resolvase